MRKNRRDPTDRLHATVWANPSAFTRATRRSVGYREPVSNAYTEGYRQGAASVIAQLQAAMAAENAEKQNEPGDDGWLTPAEAAEHPDQVLIVPMGKPADG